MHSHKPFFGGLTHWGEGKLGGGKLIYGTTFVSGVFHTCYLVSQERGMELDKKTMLLQQNAILLHDSNQNTRCLSQFGTISFIKTLCCLRRSVNFSRFIKITLLHIFLLYIFYKAIFIKKLLLIATEKHL